MKLFQLLIASTMLCAGTSSYTSNNKDIDTSTLQKDQNQWKWRTHYIPNINFEKSQLQDKTPIFYSGDMKDYKEKFMWSQCFLQPQYQYTAIKDNINDIENVEYDKLTSQWQHSIQDLCTQKEIGNRLEIYNKTLLTKTNLALQFRNNWYKIRHPFNQSLEQCIPTLFPNEMTKEIYQLNEQNNVKTIREKEYFKLKNQTEKPDFNVKQARYNFMMTDQFKTASVENYTEEYINNQLNSTYSNLKDQVQIQFAQKHQIHELKQEAQKYKCQTLTIVAILASICTHFIVGQNN